VPFTDEALVLLYARSRWFLPSPLVGFVLPFTAMHTHENNEQHRDDVSRRHKLLTAWEEEQIRLAAPYAQNLRLIEKLHPELTLTEHRVCAGIMLRKLSWEIGQLLGITEGTVNNHRSHIRTKLELPTDKALSSYLLSIRWPEQ
jgi:DNA-binding CsgD family transcriptional regulator